MVQPVSEASDAYSFAMVIVEVCARDLRSNTSPNTHQVFTGRVPFHDCMPTTVIVDVASGSRPQRPVDPNLTDDLWDLTERCWSHDPQRRQEFQRLFFAYKPLSLPNLAIACLRTTRHWGVSDRGNRRLVGFFAFLAERYSVISEGPRCQPPQLTTALNRRWRFWRFGKTSTPQFPPGRDAVSEKEGKYTDLRYRSHTTPNLPRRSGGGWFSKFKSLFKRNRYEWL